MGWAGTTLDDRRQARRRRLLAVALDLAGRAGASAVTVRSVCRHARLTDRYFYESFADRDELLVAVYDEVATEARDAILEATGEGNDAAGLATRAVERFLSVLLDDPRKGRVLLLEPLTDVTLGRRAALAVPLFTDVVAARLGPTTTPLAAEMTATAVIGALAHLFGRWLQGELAATREEVTAFGVHLLMALSRRAPD